MHFFSGLSHKLILCGGHAGGLSKTRTLVAMLLALKVRKKLDIGPPMSLQYDVSRGSWLVTGQGV